MSSRNNPSPPPTRRARRAAERARATPAVRRPTGSTKRRGSPILWITALVAVVAVVLIGALVLLQGGGRSAAVDTAGLVTPTAPTPLALADGRSLGKADAPVTLEVWSDFQCPVCGQFAVTVEPALVRNYVTPGTLRIVDHDAAFQGQRSSSSYDESVEAGAGARCAADQGRYWPFRDWLFANQAGENEGGFADARLRAIAAAAGLDLTAWDACRATGQQQAAVRAETAQAVSKGVTGTPTMYLNGQTILGLHSATDLGKMIDAAAAAAAK